MPKSKASSPKAEKPWDKLGISKSTFYRKKRKKKAPKRKRGETDISFARRQMIGGGIAEDWSAPLNPSSDPLTRTRFEAEAQHRARPPQGVTTVDVGAEIVKAVDVALVDNFLAFIGQVPADGRLIYATARQGWAVARALRAAGYGASTGTTQ